MSKDEQIADLRAQLSLMCTWVRAALDCKTWHWDGDQWEAADGSEKYSRELLEKTKPD